MRSLHTELHESDEEKPDAIAFKPGDGSALPRYPDLSGKVVLVTGGSGGIGALTSRMFAANGAKVAVNGRDSSAIESVVASIRLESGEAIGVAADTTDFQAIERMRLQVERDLGPVDVLVVFAGGGIARPGPVELTTEEEWRSTIDGNLTATFLTIKSFLPGMIGRRRGSIITMASAAARLPSPAPAPYAAAKAGILMLTRHLANEVGKHGIRVNSVAPSAILTDRTRRRLTEDQQRQIVTLHPLGRLGTPEDVALATLFLASESASWLTGITLDVAGGRISL